MSLRGRGVVGSAARTARVLSRFGATTAAMAHRLDWYDALTDELGARPTWPTTASVLGRHPDLLRSYAERGADLAVHGLVHGDHAVLGRDAQRETIIRALRIFERAGLHPSGFRGPYLRYNGATLEVLRELGFRYHSSQAVVFSVLDGEAETASYRRALQLYSARDAATRAVTPRLCDGLVDIPVAIPDDEVLVDRLGLAEEACAALWWRVLDVTHERGDLFTIQLHPERIMELGGALVATLREARRRSPSVWIARLDEIASWWLRRSRFSLGVMRTTPPDRYRILLDADPDATLLVRGADGRPWHGNDALAVATNFELRSARAPMVGISGRTPDAVHRFLAEEGFPFEVSESRGAYGAYIDVSSENWTESEVLKTLQTAAGPLVRLWRWPRAARSALAVTGDIDALTLRDFALRSWETRASSFGRLHP